MKNRYKRFLPIILAMILMLGAGRGALAWRHYETRNPETLKSRLWRFFQGFNFPVRPEPRPINPGGSGDVTSTPPNSTSALTAAEKQYVDKTLKKLDTIIADATAKNPQSDGDLVMSAQVFLAQGAITKQFSEDVIFKYIDALKAAGVQRVQVYPPTSSFVSNDTAMIEKYRRIAEYVHKLGLQLEVSPIAVGGEKVASFSQWKSTAVPAFKKIAEVMKPEVYVIVHETMTMSSRMGIQTTVSDWQGLVKEAADSIRTVLPQAQLGAGGQPYELSYYKAFAAMPELDLLTIHIYNVDNMKQYEDMVAIAKQNGKEVEIGETWRSSFDDPNVPPKNLTQAQAVAGSSIGLVKYEPLTNKWLEALTAWADANGLDGITPFWTTTFFKYVNSGGKATGLEYNNQVAEAIKKGERTGTYNFYKNLVSKYGKK